MIRYSFSTLLICCAALAALLNPVPAQALDFQFSVPIITPDPEPPQDRPTGQQEIDVAGADFFFNQGLSLAKAGDQPGAIRAFSQAIALHPHHAKAYLHRSRAHEQQGDHQAALNDLQQAIQFSRATLPMTHQFLLVW